jgi:hypothetical protein
MKDKIELFNAQWDKLIKNIKESNVVHDRKKAIALSDFYITTAKFQDEYSCLVCYKDWTREVDVPTANARATRVVMLKKELLDYYLNGWKKMEELANLTALYNEHLSNKRYLQETRQFYASKEFLEACQGMRDCKREKTRLLHEQRCVALLLKHMGLNKKKGNS